MDCRNWRQLERFPGANVSATFFGDATGRQTLSSLVACVSSLVVHAERPFLAGGRMSEASHQPRGIRCYGALQ